MKSAAVMMVGVSARVMDPQFVADVVNSNGVDDCEEFHGSTNIPDAVDWSAKFDWPVKDQDRCGSCWAFSTAGAIESMDFRNNLKYSVSEQQLMDCDKDAGTDCSGGIPALAISHYTSAEPTCTESEYPYVDCKTEEGSPSISTCHEMSSGCTEKLDLKCNKVPHNDVDALKSAIAQQPVSVLVWVNQTLWSGSALDSTRSEGECQVYNSSFGATITPGVKDFPCWNYTSNQEPDQNHAVLAVGYGVDNGVEYFKIRNSWGPNWAENGYIRLAARSALSPKAGSACLLNPFGNYASLVFPTSKSPTPPPTPPPSPTPTPSPVPLACKYIDPRYTMCCEHGGVAVVCAKGQTCGVLAGLPACLLSGEVAV